MTTYVMRAYAPNGTGLYYPDWGRAPARGRLSPLALAGRPLVVYCGPNYLYRVCYPGDLPRLEGA